MRGEKKRRKTVKMKDKEGRVVVGEDVLEEMAKHWEEERRSVRFGERR